MHGKLGRNPREVARRGTDLLAARAIRQNLSSEVPAAAQEAQASGFQNHQLRPAT
jgi:hypothetical protein